MKTKEVPQDDAGMMQGKYREPMYSLDKDGNYTTVRSVGWEPKNEVFLEALAAINEKIEDTRQKVLSGELSPIAYFTELNKMDAGLLAKYMGFWKWTVKRHFKPKNFNKLSDKVLERYAGVFEISKEKLTDIEGLRKAKPVDLTDSLKERDD
jgi:hypothetical protein